MKVSDLFVLIQDGGAAEEFAVPTGASLEVGNRHSDVGDGWKVGHRGSPLTVERPAPRGVPLPRSRAIESARCADAFTTTALVRARFHLSSTFDRRARRRFRRNMQK